LAAFDQTQIAGVKAVEIYSKLRVLGKPGAGKTTFLQYLAVRCNQSRFAANRVPVFVTLRDFADESREGLNLFNYLRREFLASGISEPSTLETLLRSGKLLLLLDGLDEVQDQARRTVANEIRRLCEKYPQNLFVVTCRTAAQALHLNRFTDVEVAPFTQDQIVVFAQKWFATFTKAIPQATSQSTSQSTSQAGQKQAVEFIQVLSLPENLPFRRLAVTPLFLHLACWIFHHQGKLPTQRSEFYKQCLDLLLRKWDEAKGMEREEIYHGFSIPQKLKLFSRIATITFEQGDYFFERQMVERQIEDYLRDLPNASTELEELQAESESILRQIELQHGLLSERGQGVFSFSDQVFQEYFTAQKIVASHHLQVSDRSLEQLVSHITDPRWREIFLLTVTMLRSAESLMQLMKQQIDAIAAEDPDLQAFLSWASKRSLAAPSQAAMIQLFYLALARIPCLAPRFAIAGMLNHLQPNWQFSPEQQAILQRYSVASQLLVDCLNREDEVSATVRQEIETALLFAQNQPEERQ
ncbi:MAG TPA: NACHT domain-containing protein, partial [Leptolyngbya sp.]|nr:NACHT domain-containing protein [Leptolyngbya sp.]